MRKRFSYSSAERLEGHLETALPMELFAMITISTQARAATLPKGREW